MNQIPAENTISIDELQTAFSQSYGAIIAQLTIKNLSLEKQLRAQADYTQEMTTNEAQLVQQMQDLETELVKLKSSPPPLSLAEREIAAQGSAIIADGKADGKEKA